MNLLRFSLTLGLLAGATGCFNEVDENEVCWSDDETCDGESARSGGAQFGISGLFGGEKGQSEDTFVDDINAGIPSASRDEGEAGRSTAEGAGQHSSPTAGELGPTAGVVSVDGGNQAIAGTGTDGPTAGSAGLMQEPGGAISPPDGEPIYPSRCGDRLLTGSEECESEDEGCSSVCLLTDQRFQAATQYRFGPPDNLDDGLKPEITISRPVTWDRTELTVGEWNRVMAQTDGPADAQRPSDGADDENRPVTGVTWWDALEFANRRSQTEGFPQCYALQDCQRDRGRTTCQSVSINTLSGKPQDCAGYRLPSAMEWLDAAQEGVEIYENWRVGPPAQAACAAAANWDPRSWDCRAELESPQQVAASQAFRNGLFDIMGNVREWNWDDAVPAQDVIDFSSRGGRVALENSRAFVLGGAFGTLPQDPIKMVNFSISTLEQSPDIGFRLVRTERVSDCAEACDPLGSRLFTTTTYTTLTHPANDDPNRHEFGQAVALTSKFQCVGSPKTGRQDGQGKVVCYPRSAVDASAVLLSAPANTMNPDSFGASMAALSNADGLLVGLPRTQNPDGSLVYCYPSVGDESTRITLPTIERLKAPEGNVVIEASAKWVAVGFPNGKAPGMGPSAWSKAGQVYVAPVSDALPCPNMASAFVLVGSAKDAKLGTSLAIENDTLVVGAPGIEKPTGLQVGAVFVYHIPTLRTRPTPDTTVNAQQLADWHQDNPGRQVLADPTGTESNFGQVLAMDNDTLVIAAPQTETLFVYKKHRGWFELIQKIATPSSGNQFGLSLALHGQTLLVGAPGDSLSQGDEEFLLAGLIYQYEQGPDGRFYQRAAIQPEDPAADLRFGSTMDIDATVLISSAPGGVDGHGEVHSMAAPRRLCIGPARCSCTSGALGDLCQDRVEQPCPEAPDGSQCAPCAVPTTIPRLRLVPNGDSRKVAGHSANGRLGTSLTSGDFFAVGAPGSNGGEIRHSVSDPNRPPSVLAAPNSYQFSDKQYLRAESTRFGHAVARSEDMVVIGAPRAGFEVVAEGIPTTTEAGGVFVYAGQDNLDVEQLYAGFEEDSRMGEAVTILQHGRIIVAGAPGTTDENDFKAGAIHFLNLQDQAWSPILTDGGKSAWTKPNTESFGFSMAADNQWLAVGAPRTMTDLNYRGSVVMYRLPSTSDRPIESPPLSFGMPDVAMTPTAHGQLGFSLAMDQHQLIVGAPFDDRAANGYKSPPFEDGADAEGCGPNSRYDKFFTNGTAYVFTKDPTKHAWLDNPERLDIVLPDLPANTLNTGYNFGYSVDVRDNLAIVGAPAAKLNAYHYHIAFSRNIYETCPFEGGRPTPKLMGRAYIFERIDGAWHLVTSIKSPLISPNANVNYGDDFGYAVHVSANERFLIGAPGDNQNTGQVFEYEYEYVDRLYCADNAPLRLVDD